MHQTKIEYLTDCWNPIVGCDGIGCAVAKVCWARGQAKRQKHRCDLCYSFVPHVHFEREDEPLKRKKPSRIGVSFMGEFFTQNVADWVRYRLYMTMEKCPQHTFIIFTKQPQNIDLTEPIPKNVCIGVSVNTKRDLWRINVLRQVETSCRILSAESLYEDLEKINLEGIGWVIIGAQTRPNFQPKAEWVYSLSHQASELNIPVFWKSNLTTTYGKRQEFPK